MPSPIGPDFHYHTKIAREASISPDGASVVYTVGRFERDSPLELKDVYVQKLEGGEPSLLLENASLAAWSPDGSQVAFLRADAGGVGQLWKCAADGSDAVQVTQQAGSVDVFAWSPSGDQIAFRADVNPDTGRDELAPRITDRIRFHQDGFGWRGDAFRQIFVLDVPSGESRQLTDDEAEHGPPVWSP
ncbi:MAG: hypothetical protein O2788_00690, partial [Chloroflexi bacterium]|nr:hypothetical protein [Chloroflexota bacterium]